MPVEILVGGRQLNCLYVLAESSLRLSSTEAVLRQINWGLCLLLITPKKKTPARGYIVSANYQPLPDSGIKVPGYYNLPARGIRLDQRLANNTVKWNLQNSQALQLDTGSGYAKRLLKPLLPIIQATASDDEQELVNLLSKWNGEHNLDDIAPRFLTS